jgi:hypothetical protein
MKIFQKLQNYHVNLVDFYFKIKFFPSSTVKIFKIFEKMGNDPVTLVLNIPNNPVSLIMITTPLALNWDHKSGVQGSIPCTLDLDTLVV